jgi:hypothetical protein
VKITTLSRQLHTSDRVMRAEVKMTSTQLDTSDRRIIIYLQMVSLQMISLQS